ncbi:hypothetical protein APTSU1_001172600 [Apodemus speciosus]|uniref:Uncharacterized protein n=1 Tax=Apodemus speciosus TaxID=105296 RepID=A0ABQ0FBG7_APOSI
MALVTVQRSPTPSTTSSPCASGGRQWGGGMPVTAQK